MRRRRVLRLSLGAAIGVGIAGCLGTQNAGESPTDSPETSDTGTGSSPSETGTPTRSATISDQTIEIDSRECGTETNLARVEFGTAITVTGTITGSDACQTAEIASATVDSNRLRLVVGTVRDESSDSEVCGQCLTEIDYQVTVEFDGPLPEAVTVEHRSLGAAQTVAESSR